ncbi:MAG TPA: metallophosphoesterase family protein [Blastocatellia bacterium]|nr:metallophosphoesterase family protein [Blastocatellia bacterium]
MENVPPVIADNNKTGRLRRAGVLGDIHCEDGRLETALRLFEAESLDLICAVGDIVDGPGDPNRAIDLLVEHDVVCVRGNHERWLLNDKMRDLPDANTRFDFNPSSWEFVKKLPLWRKLETVAGAALLCHGLGEYDMGGVLPWNDDSTRQTNHALWELVDAHEYDFVINGHTHRRLVRKFDDLTLINAGTLFREHAPCCLIIDFEARVAEYFNLPAEDNIVKAERIEL